MNKIKTCIETIDIKQSKCYNFIGNKVITKKQLAYRNLKIKDKEMEEDMIDFNKYNEALNYIKRYFTQDLKELEIVSAQIFGSSTYEEGFIEGVSDIDICIFTPKMYSMKYQQIVDYIIRNTHGDFIDKKPSIVMDYIGNRIEFYINHPQIPIDITVMAPDLPNSNNMYETVAHDAVDVLLGAFYQHGVSLIGQVPKKELIEKEFFPFYNKELRKKRLDMLMPRIEKYNKRIELLIENQNNDILDHVYKARTYFLKWLFIYKRKYPVNMNKHLNYQLSKILNLPKDEKEKIMFVGEGNLFELASNYLQIANNYLSEYKEK